jgi:hypothetical protein
MARGLQQIKQEMRQAYEAGDKDTAYKLFDEYKQRDASRQRSLANAGEQYSATDGMSGFDKFHQGAASGLVNVARRAGQILTPKSLEKNSVFDVSDQAIENQSETDAELASTGPGAFGRFFTEAALTAPVGGAAGKGVLKAASLLRGGKAAGKVAKLAGLATEGAVGGELTSGDAAEGALWNLGIAGGLKAAKRIAQGSKNITPEARRLTDAGVDMTPGQMHPRGTISQLEQGAERVPFIGPYVQEHRRKLVPSAMRSLFEKEFGEAVPADAGFDDMVRKTNDRLGARYDAVRAQAGNVKVGGGNQLQQEWAQAVNSPNLLVSPEARQASGRWLAGQLDALKARGNGVSAEDLLAIRSRIRDEVRKAHRGGQGAALERAEVLELAEDAITTQVNNALPPKVQQLLQETDQLYARYKPLEQAGFAAAARAGGEPTVGQLVGALKQQAGQSRWAGRGAGRNQQFLEDIRDAAETTIRPTGAALPWMAAGGLLSPFTALGMTKTGKRLYSGRTRPQRAAQKTIRAAQVTPGVRTLVEILRRGSAGALADR